VGANSGGNVYGNSSSNVGPNLGTDVEAPIIINVTKPLLSFMTNLNLLDLRQLINDSLLHDSTWPQMRTKLPLNIPKFEGNLGEDPTNHI